MARTYNYDEDTVQEGRRTSAQECASTQTDPNVCEMRGLHPPYASSPVQAGLISDGRAAARHKVDTVDTTWQDGTQMLGRTFVGMIGLGVWPTT